MYNLTSLDIGIHLYTIITIKLENSYHLQKFPCVPLFLIRTFNMRSALNILKHSIQYCLTVGTVMFSTPLALFHLV